jgi:hypothetical protein
MKLSLRELFLLVVIAAMGCGWWVDRSSVSAVCERKMKENSEYFRELCTAVHEVGYAILIDAKDGIRIFPGKGPP